MLPIKQVNGAIVYLRDVATVSERFRIPDQYRAAGRPPRRARSPC